jgi:hypothetical protein
MSLLDTFTETVNSDNRHEYIEKDETAEIVIGGDATHIFEFPFDYTNYIKSAICYYKQGKDIILEIDVTPTDVTVDDKRTCSTITLELRPVQTQLFKTTNLDTKCQFRFVTVDDKIIFDEPHDVKIITPLKVEPVVETSED